MLAFLLQDQGIKGSSNSRSRKKNGSSKHNTDHMKCRMLALHIKRIDEIELEFN
jgi:hypothetical protein